ncbi:hypothetical protein FSC37_10045 [Piscinibacter aquaticus]|uniref:Uncharacterized protein n=1 Tax=Piscinibacter aquaticus TaxID=392597 RepID=A0A5C6U349_9BURK|nr:hypothetical protein FSC37_10045 [Piscinibacter aquaticus]
MTEDRIQQAGLRLPVGRQLATRSPELRALARIAGLEGSGVLHRSAVEQVFSRLVLQAHGAAPQELSLPGSAAFAATVVLLRELMHHLGFETLHVHESEQHPPPKGQPR